MPVSLKIQASCYVVDFISNPRQQGPQWENQKSELFIKFFLKRLSKSYMEEVMVRGRMVMAPNGSATVHQHNPRDRGFPRLGSGTQNIGCIFGAFSPRR